MPVNMEQVNSQIREKVEDLELEQALAQKRQWFSGETLRLPSGRMLKSGSGAIRLYAGNAAGVRVAVLHPTMGWIRE